MKYLIIFLMMASPVFASDVIDGTYESHNKSRITFINGSWSVTENLRVYGKYYALKEKGHYLLVSKNNMIFKYLMLTKGDGLHNMNLESGNKMCSRQQVLYKKVKKSKKKR
jgi:hypothetical protein